MSSKILDTDLETSTTLKTKGGRCTITLSRKIGGGSGHPLTRLWRSTPSSFFAVSFPTSSNSVYQSRLTSPARSNSLLLDFRLQALSNPLQSIIIEYDP
jgi:hypothetical protein